MKYIALLLALSFSLCAADLSFQLKGADRSSFSLEELKNKIKAKEVKVWEPHEDKEVTYIGFDFNELLNLAYGDSWKKEEEILFTCSDGYQPSIPVTRFMQHKAYLAFERKSSAFLLKDRFHNNDEIPLAPFYLVWDNIQDAEVKAEGAAGWPWALVKVDLIEFSQKFPLIAPPKKSKAEVAHGFVLFRAKCLSCHSINGDGGTKGVELNTPHSVTEYFKPEFLKKWITDPASVRANAAMPKFNTDSPHWKRDLNDIIEYLKAMAKARPVALKQ